MTVENTNPIQHFTANGETTVFAISFAVEGKDNIKVTVNGSVVSVNDYSYDTLTKAVVFNAAPEDGVEVVVERVTSLDRSINYQTYDNSFRPETLNYDLDRIWHVLQEDKITDAEILARIKDEIEWRRTHNTEWDLLAQTREQGLFNALKSYMDTIGAMSVPNLFDGITDNVVITEEGLSQRVTNRGLKEAVTQLGAELEQLEISSRVYTDRETTRATEAEQILDQKITTEKVRAEVTEQQLQQQINVLGVGNKAYKTFADMTADAANIPANSKVTVTNDTDISKNGDYQYNGLEFVKSSYDILVQAKEAATNIDLLGNWLAIDSFKEVAQLPATDIKFLISKAIKRIGILNAIEGEEYWVSSVYKNSSSGSRITINSAIGTVGSITIPVETIVSGTQEYNFSNIRTGRVIINWDELPVTITSGLTLKINNKEEKEYIKQARFDTYLKNVISPKWIDPNHLTAFYEASDSYIQAASAIESLQINGADPIKTYSVIAVGKNHPTYGSRVMISSEGVNVATYIVGAEVVKKGKEAITLTGSFAVTAEVVINWDSLPDGFLATGNTTFLVINKDYKLSENLQATNILPDWYNPLYTERFYKLTAMEKILVNAIKGAEFKDSNNFQNFRISVFAKNHPTYGNRIFMTEGTNITVLRFDEQGVNRNEVSTVKLVANSVSGVSGTITIDWSQLPDGLLINGLTGNINFYPKAKNFSDAIFKAEKNEATLANLENVSSSGSAVASIPSKNYRVSVAGSSITWGGGYLGEKSYVGVIEQKLRNEYATTIHAKNIDSTATTLVGSDFYLGEAKRISGLNKEVSFTLTGDELTISIARERENTGASIIELYIDNTLYTTFNTLNPKPSEEKTESFNGDGANVKFNLASCFTYNHVVTVGGTTLKGSLSTGGSGVSIPTSDDYMIVRRYDQATEQVVHTLWFKNAPTGAIVVTYKKGENIRHLKGTIDRVGSGFTSALENPYGDGAISYDTTLPSSVSSGFGFRESDSRSALTWKFDKVATRTFKLKIKALHSQATGAVPYFDLNFVTNRMHHIQNAGIGGWEASEFINSPIKLNMIEKIIDFNPDLVLIESCTNDDWSTGLYKATVTKTGLTASQILAEPTANYFKSITGTASNKTVEDVRLPIVSITAKTITLDAIVNDAEIAVGDIVVIGEYGGSHKRVAVRKVKGYDRNTKTIALNRSITPEEFKQISNLNELKTEYVTVWNAPTWTANVETLINTINEALPNCEVNLATAGINHNYLRKLFGYREIGQLVAKKNRVGFVDFYDATFAYQYSQKSVVHQTITSTGSATYSLNSTGNTFPDPRVFVNGVEHTKFRVVGGLTKHWASDITNPTLSNTSNSAKAYTLIFDSEVPTSGALIEVYKSNQTWATDYCHPKDSEGYFVFGAAASKILKEIK